MQHTDLLKSLEDPNTYLVSASGGPLQQSLSGLLLDGLPPSASAAFLPKAGQLLIAGYTVPVRAVAIARLSHLFLPSHCKASLTNSAGLCWGHYD